MSVLAKEIGKPRTTLIEHIESLTNEGMIQKHQYSVVAFALIPTVTVGEPTGVSVSRPITIKTLSIKKESLSELKKKDVGQPTPVGAPTVAAEIAEMLKNAGVGEPMRTKIAVSGVDLIYVKIWLNWMDSESKPLNHIIAAMRDGLPAPDYCYVCKGWEGEHKSVVDEDDHLMMCPLEGRPDLSARDAFEIYGEVNPV